MEPFPFARLIADLLVILAAGLASGILCKRLGVSMLVGYLVVGALLGDGGLGLVSRSNYGPAAAGGHAMEYLAHAGALFLLFSIGINFSFPELLGLGRYLLLGGSVQMALVIVPVSLVCAILGMKWPSAVLVASAAALSSTVLVFKALEEWGQADTGHGRRALGILLFQDVALVPLMLLVPMLTAAGSAPGIDTWLILAAKSVLFVAGVVALRAVISRWGFPLLAKLRSVELMVLFTLIVVGGVSLAARLIDLPAAVGALAAGLILGDNRLSGQVEAVVLPFRETFAAVFFVSLGALLRLDFLLDRPHLALGGLVLVLAWKTVAAAAALRLIGLRWRAAWGMGLGLAQLGELSFVLLSTGASAASGVIDPATYDAVLFIALATLIFTPQLLKIGLSWAGDALDQERERPGPAGLLSAPADRAVVVGIGLIGGRVASHLETNGLDVCLIDLSPVNLHPFVQQGFRTVAGDATDPEILRHAGVPRCRLAVVAVPHDPTAGRVVAAVRQLNPSAVILVRCRFQANIQAIRRAGATAVVSEEAEAAGALLRALERLANP